MVNLITTIGKNLQPHDRARSRRGPIHIDASKRVNKDRALPPANHNNPRSRKRVEALTIIILSMYLGIMILGLALLVFWVLSQFTPLS